MHFLFVIRVYHIVMLHKFQLFSYTINIIIMLENMVVWRDVWRREHYLEYL